jgi:signal transduction histidine kinase
MNWRMTSFYQVVASLTTQLDGQMSDRHTLLLDVDENLPPFYMDGDKVRAVLNNLVNNAVKYSPEGGEIILKAELIVDPAQLPEVELPSPDLLILISVKDEGVGIPEEALPHIFDRFYRVDNSLTRQIGGTGLGLTIAKALVELHGGIIWVQSKVDQGSAFYFTLPIRDRPPREEKESPFRFDEGGGYEEKSPLR